MNDDDIKMALTPLVVISKWALLCLLLMPSLSYSQERVLVVMSAQGKIYQTFYSTLKKQLHNNFRVSQVSISDINDDLINNNDSIISIGYKSAIAMSELKTQKPVFYSLIPDNESLQSKIPCKKPTCYKIYINQPINRYIKLFKILFPEGKKLVFASTDEQIKKSQAIKIAAKNNAVMYKKLRVQKNSVISRYFIRTLNHNDVLLALPNPEIYNAHSAQSIILSTYHANVPIIAYSKSFAKAGALISLYSSIDNIAVKTANVVNKIYKDGQQQQKEYYADEFTLEINSAVARSLNIELDSKNIIKRKMQ
ncbi:MAG: ABC transporter substrate binding protein [Woeseiaceae bacterium]